MLKRISQVFKQRPALMWWTAAFLVILLFTRFYNLDRTARFTQDESRDLLRMEQLVSDKKITLVGPISNDNTKVFGSLTYAMWLPFVVASNYDPVSPAYGTAFWGVLTALFLMAITWKINPKYIWWTAILVLIWYPLVETSRWAWNPHLVTFWIALGVLTYLLKFRWSYFFSGIFLGLAFHNHYIVLFSTAVFVFAVAIQAYKAKDWRFAAQIIGGYILTFLPFIIFDLRHPPGLFFSKYLSGTETPNTIALTPAVVFERVTGNISVITGYLALPFFKWIFILCTVGILWLERKKLSRLIWISPVAVQVVMGSLFTDLQTRYFLPAIVFFFVWLILPRQGFVQVLAKSILVICIVSSMFTIVPQLTQTKVPPDIYSLRAATNFIATKITEKNLQNPNVATLASPDSDPLSNIYREALAVKHIHLKAASQYDTSENLFVVSTSDSETVKQDDAVAMKIFSKGILEQTFTIPDSDWKVYWFRY